MFLTTFHHFPDNPKEETFGSNTVNKRFLTLLQMFLIFQKQIPELESFLFAICNLQKLLMTLAGL